jgi:hypothetical protein
MFFAAATFVLAFVILLILANVMHLEKGGTGDDAHKTTGLAWVFIVIALVIGMCIGGLPGMHDSVIRPLLEQGGVNFSASADTNASASASASATATTGSLDASAEGIRQTTKHFASIKKNGRKLTSFPVIGDGWEWYVLDSSVSTTIGQKVTTGEYEVTDASVTSVTVYIARNVGGTWEFGDPRPFSL